MTTQNILLLNAELSLRRKTKSCKLSPSHTPTRTQACAHPNGINRSASQLPGTMYTRWPCQHCLEMNSWTCDIVSSLPTEVLSRKWSFRCWNNVFLKQKNELTYFFRSQFKNVPLVVFRFFESQSVNDYYSVTLVNKQTTCTFKNIFLPPLNSNSSKHSLFLTQTRSWKNQSCGSPRYSEYCKQLN